MNENEREMCVLERGSLLLVMAFLLLLLSSRHPLFVLLLFFWVTCPDRSFASPSFPYYSSLLSSHLSLTSTHRHRPVGCLPSSFLVCSLPSPLLFLSRRTV